MFAGKTPMNISLKHVTTGRQVANSHGSGAHFQRVQRAWETLRCPQQRLAYDSTTRCAMGETWGDLQKWGSTNDDPSTYV
jgi:curved DNA-binding protein CbpA